jgi:2-keto-3-deoxy-L-rhamnonate aldolase RhmA
MSADKEAIMRERGLLWGAATCAALSLAVAWPHAQVGQPQADSRPQGWAVRASLKNPTAKLYNNAKQKLLDGKQIYGYTISKLDTKLYCDVAQHWDFIWFEMQHSTMSFRDVEEMIGTCPRPIATPIIRVPDEFESTIQKATDIGALGINIPTVDTVEKAVAGARYSRYPPEGRRSQGANQAQSIWGVNGINYRQTINDNMLVIEQIETPVGVNSAFAIASVQGVDVILGSTGDMQNFSGLQPSDPVYQLYFTQIHDATLRAGKFLGAVPASYGKPGPPGVGRPDHDDWRFFYNGPSFDGFQPPGGRGRGRSSGGDGTGGRGGGR